MKMENNKLYLENSLELENTLLILPNGVKSLFYRFIPNVIFIEANKLDLIKLESPSLEITNLVLDARIDLSKITNSLKSILGKNLFRRIEEIFVVETYTTYKHEYYYLDFPYSLVSSFGYELIKEVLDYGSTRFVFKPLGGSRNLGVFVVELEKLFELDRASLINKYQNLRETLSPKELLLKFFSELGAVILFDLNSASESDLKFLVETYFEKASFTIQPYVEGFDVRIVGNHKGEFEVLKPSNFDKENLERPVREILEHLEKLKIFYPFFTMDFRFDQEREKLYLLEIQSGSVVNQDYGVEKFLKVLV